MLERVQNQQDLAQHLHNLAVKGFIVSAVALYKISDEGHYLTLGYEDFKSYAEEMLPFSYRHAKSHLTIGRNLSRLNGDLVNNESININGKEQGALLRETCFPQPDNEGLTCEPSENSEQRLIIHPKVNQLTLRKMLILCRLGEATFNCLMSTGKSMIPIPAKSLTGIEYHTFTLDNFIQMSESEIKNTLFPALETFETPALPPVKNEEYRPLRETVQQVKFTMIKFQGLTMQLPENCPDELKTKIKTAGKTIEQIYFELREELK